MEPIEMARECYIACFVENTPKSIIEVTRSGEVDGQAAIQAALHMHTMRQAEIDTKDAAIAELVECLAASFADPMRLMNSESAMNQCAAMIAKHRPDAFAKWAEGLIDGEG